MYHWFGLRELCATLSNPERSAMTSLALLEEITALAGVPAIRLARVLAKLTQVEMVGIYAIENSGPLVYLTHKAAALLRLRLTDDVPPHWASIDDREPADHMERQKRQAGQAASAWALEHAQARQPRSVSATGACLDIDDGPEECTVYGLRVQWPLAGMDTVEPVREPLPLHCPGCGAYLLEGRDCCVICDRTGMDRAFSRTGRRREQLAGHTRYVPGRLKGGLGA